MLIFQDWYENHRSSCDCPNIHYPLTMEEVVIDQDAIMHLYRFLRRKEYSHALVVCDDQTKSMADTIICDEQMPCRFTKSLLLPDNQGDVLADEKAIVHVLIDLPADIDVMIAVGSGTIHDITRFVSYKVGLPFISFPTAPSVDGFNSMGAPIVVNKKKITFQTHAPIALFADLTILCDAPQGMVAAGFGDMLGKYTSLVDWEFGHNMANEPYCPAVARMTREALNNCVANSELIKEKDREGIRVLMTALIQSGMAMAMFGRSHPASGAEHHLSHFWEMTFIEEERKQLLHGAKVGVAAGVIADLYHNEVKDLFKRDPNSDTAFLTRLIDRIPSGEELRQFIYQAGGKATPNELGIESNLLQESIHKAHNIRDRATLLRYRNRHTLTS
ncbi:sn-glycerol-1-phosphate dehydrogenase [Salipaludibacillus agaradhaerens]|uniref:sn-glycerol-1-phosphate dehydrogenase n=1 Tax=Salipaludibacillus agaradhaerens TaxID=76935 RepID=UPI000997E285|nr:sn-glycerol-1-phosphate dehydrogenase [Salipaludibacillus agaradhaerens]